MTLLTISLVLAAGLPTINVVLAFMVIASFLLSTVLHGYGQTLIAALLGDPGPRNEGRQTLNLRPHLDPVGTLISVVLAFYPIYLLPIGLGWGKPIKPDPWKMRVGPNTGVLLVALSGILINLLVGAATALILHFIYPPLSGVGDNPLVVRLLQLLIVFAAVNIALAIFNLLPLYPLDGYQIVYALLPSRQAAQFARSAAYGPFIVVVLFFVLPFLAQISRLDFFLFRLPTVIASWALSLIGLLVGNINVIMLYYPQ
jgi:Zn-dependent protease